MWKNFDLFFLFLVQKEKTLGFFSSSFVSLSVCSSSSHHE